MLADFLRLRAEAQTPRTKSVIMVLLIGGPSHIDMYDMKPDAPVEIRGDFKPIQTNVPGIAICEHMPRQAKLADKLAIVRNMKFTGDNHSGEQLTTGWRADNNARLKRPAHGAIVSYLREKEKGGPTEVPSYVVLSPPMNDGPVFRDEFGALYAGPAHRPFSPTSGAFDDLGLTAGMTRERLGERKTLLRAFDTLRRDLDSRAELAGMDRFTAQAFEMMVSEKTRNALDISREPEPVREKYGIRGPQCGRGRALAPGAPARRSGGAGRELPRGRSGGLGHAHRQLFEPAAVAAADPGQRPSGPGERPARTGPGQGCRGRGLGRDGPHAQGRKGSGRRRPRSLA